MTGSQGKLNKQIEQGLQLGIKRPDLNKLFFKSAKAEGQRVRKTWEHRDGAEEDLGKLGR